MMTIELLYDNLSDFLAWHVPIYIFDTGQCLYPARCSCYKAKHKYIGQLFRAAKPRGHPWELHSSFTPPPREACEEKWCFSGNEPAPQPQQTTP